MAITKTSLWLRSFARTVSLWFCIQHKNKWKNKLWTKSKLISHKPMAAFVSNKIYRTLTAVHPFNCPCAVRCVCVLFIVCHSTNICIAIRAIRRSHSTLNHAIWIIHGWIRVFSTTTTTREKENGNARNGAHRMAERNCNYNARNTRLSPYRVKILQFGEYNPLRCLFPRQTGPILCSNGRAITIFVPNTLLVSVPMGHSIQFAIDECVWKPQMLRRQSQAKHCLLIQFFPRLHDIFS